jgi:hypothetical protein
MTTDNNHPRAPLTFRQRDVCAEPTAKSRKSDARDLSAHLSQSRRQIDGGQFDDWPDLPPSLQRAPSATASNRAPALGPPGDSLDDF